ncbi:MAG: hypothetical protein DRQ49_14990 [Gammaproteobacteria bacterium]|nr:MAG: hypothetical protein DRQ49_14990 [Gammaproteobacteria bacterium]RKZ42607.1 MAG: hypothetical protein DRQ41_06790 [Gammaproteobacteria bacterium]RKZ72753.1 MAG: hypothetical protein DRQ57_16465 [Gammaproteobacteria bacterium]
MAKEIYVEKFLSDDMIVAGKQLMKRLEAIMPVTGSFWLYTSEAEAWRLYVVTPRVLSDGIRKVYDTILNALETSPQHEYILPLVCVYPTDDNNHYVSLLHNVRLSDKLIDTRLSGVGINGSGYIEDAYIYRLYEAKESSLLSSTAFNEKPAVA